MAAGRRGKAGLAWARSLQLSCLPLPLIPIEPRATRGLSDARCCPLSLGRQLLQPQVTAFLRLPAWTAVPRGRYQPKENDGFSLGFVFRVHESPESCLSFA